MACSSARVAGEHQMGMAVDQAGRDPRPAERGHLAGAEAGQLGPAADPNDPAAVDADRGVADDPERVAGARDHRRDMTVGDQAVPHAIGHKRTGC